MQLEEINENSFFCYLTAGDLSARQLTQNDLHYGNSNARKLFAEIIERAEDELHFQQKELPLMIEAIPMQEDELFLQITKIEEAEELDPRFAQFSPSILEDLDDIDELDGTEFLPDPPPEQEEARPFGVVIEHPSRTTTNVIFRFENYEYLMMAIQAVGGPFLSKSSLYYNPKDKNFFLILQHSKNYPSYGLFYDYITQAKPCTRLRLSFIKEHYICVIPSNATRRLYEGLSSTGISSKE